MKKSFFYSIAAILALAACSKEADVKVPTGETVTIIASVDQTRSTESHASFSWVAGEEQISVGTSDAEYVTFDVTDAENGLFAHTFTGETPQLLVAVSPVQTNAEFVDEGSYEVELPAVYNGYDPSKGTTNALMIGTPDPNVPNKFNFRHAAALLKITYANVPVGTSHLRFKADKIIAGSIIIEGTDVAAIEIANTNDQFDDPNASDEVYVNLVDPVSEAGSSLTFYVPVPTGSYSRLEIALGNTQGDIANTVKVMDRAGKSPLTLARGDVFNFPTITLTPAPVDQYYVKVTSLDQIVDGAQYVVGAWVNDPEGDVFYAIPVNPTLNSGKIDGREVTVSSNGIAISDADGFAWTLSKEGSFWTLSDGTDYLYHSNGGVSGTNLGYGKTASYLWSISEGESGRFKFTGVADGEVKTRGMLFNGTVFGGYALSNFNSYYGIDLYVLAGEDQRTGVTLSFETSSYELSLGTEDYSNFAGQTATTDPSGVAGVKYALTGDAVGTVNEDTGAVTLDGTTTGTATITASFAGNNNYKPATSVSYTITVDDPNVVDYVTLDWTYPAAGEDATKEGIQAIAGVTASGLGTNYGSDHAPYLIKFDNTGDYIRVKTDAAIGEVSVKYKMIGGNSTSKLIISESTDGDDWTEVEQLTISGAQNDTGELTTTEAFASTSRFVEIAFQKGSNVGIGGISIKKVDTTPRFTVESQLEASAAADEYTVNITRKYFTDAITVAVPQGCNWVHADNVAANANSFTVTVDANTGSARTATLTLSADGVTSQELVVNQAGAEPGSAANPYTVPQALTAIDALADNGTTDIVYVSGIISTVESYDNSHKSITYFISTDGTTSNQLEVYSGKGVDGADFVDIADLAIGDEVVVKGNLKKFVKDGIVTPEFNYNSEIVTFTPTTRYTVSLLSVSHGTIAASKTSVGAQSVVTLTATPANGYEFDEWTVTNLSTNQTIPVTEANEFIMPAANVSVSATFTEAQGGEPLVLTFDLTSNPGGWPTENSTTLTNYTYKLGGEDYTFGLKNVKQNSGYLMCTATAVLGLPAIDGYKLTKIVANNSSNCSTSTKVGISSSASSASYISGGAIQTWSTTSSAYTYNLSGTAANTVYYLYITNKNAQITALTLTYSPAN